MDRQDEEEELGTTTKGKRGELIVIGELLRRSFEVFTPVVDSGIDCLVKAGEGNYKEIQIKYRENSPIFNVRGLKPRDGFFIICYLKSQYEEHMWVVPSKVFYEKGRPIQVRGREARQLIVGKEGSDVWESLRFYDRNFNALLSGATKDVRNAVHEASQRIKEPHFTQSDFEREILSMLAAETQPLGRKEIVRRLHERLGGRFSDADREELSRGGPRWEKNARWAITTLNQRRLIEAKARNQWLITAKGREAFAKSP